MTKPTQGPEYAYFTVADYDKTPALVEFARQVAKVVPLLSSNGTARYLREAGLPVTSVTEIIKHSIAHRLANANGAPAAVLKFEEGRKIIDWTAEVLSEYDLLNGRIKTLRPECMGPILAAPDQIGELQRLGMCRIVLNRTSFYAFRREVQRDGSTLKSIRQKLDIGGPTGIMCTIKADGLPIIFAEDHDEVLQYLWSDRINDEFRRRMQRKAAWHVADYYQQVARWLTEIPMPA